MIEMKILIQWPGYYWLQNAYYKWWLHGHFMGYAPVGTAIAASVNNPGSGMIALIAKNSGIYDK
jgi:hypothetical protein